MGKERKTLYLCEGTRVRSFFDVTEQVPLSARKRVVDKHCGFHRDTNYDCSEKLGINSQNPYEILSKARKLEEYTAQNEMEEKFVDADEDVKSISKSK